MYFKSQGSELSAEQIGCSMLIYQISIQEVTNLNLSQDTSYPD
jgi:hypothetical protein